MADPRTDPFITPTQYKANLVTDTATDLGNLRAYVAAALAGMQTQRGTSVVIQSSVYQAVNVTSVVAELQADGWTVNQGTRQFTIVLP